MVLMQVDRAHCVLTNRKAQSDYDRYFATSKVYDPVMNKFIENNSNTAVTSVYNNVQPSAPVAPKSPPPSYDSFVTDDTRGISGLENVGNTCYMNSLIQALSCIPYFKSFLVADDVEALLRKVSASRIDKNNKKFQKMKSNILSGDKDKILKSFNDNRPMYNELSDAPMSIVIKIVETLGFLPRLYRQDIIDAIDKELAKFGDKDAHLDKYVSKTITMTLCRLVRGIWNDNLVIRPDEFKGVMGDYSQQFADEFYGYKQNDNHELLLLVLDAMHKEMCIPQKLLYTGDEKTKKALKLKEEYMSVMTSDNISVDKKAQATDLYDVHTRDNPIEHVNVLAYENKFSLMKNEGRSIITDLFTGQTCSVLSCLSCNHRKYTIESFRAWTLEIPPDEKRADNRYEIDIEECMEYFSRKESREGYKCDKCQQVDTTEARNLLWDTGEILVVHFNRFKSETRVHPYTQHVSTHITADKEKVTFPIKGLVLDKCMNEGKVSPVYDLCSVVYHSGQYRGGHYIAYGHNEMDDQWYEFNDSSVTRIDAGIDELIQSGNSYMLMYRRRRTDDLDQEDLDSDE